jgi:hypothetical protein
MIPTKTRAQLEKRKNEAARRYAETHDEKYKAELLIGLTRQRIAQLANELSINGSRWYRQLA